MDMRQRTSPYWFIMFGMIFFILINSTLQGLVFCVGSDGHKAIESEHEAACRHAGHFQADPTDSRQHSSIVNDWDPNFFCRDVHFHLDRLVTGSESRQKKHQAPLLVHPMPYHWKSDVPIFGLDDFHPYFYCHCIIPLLEKTSILKC
jgi:hypothetical protein